MYKSTIVALTLAASLLASTPQSATAAPNGNFRGFLDHHPAIAADLYRHPGYLHNQGWIGSHPELQSYLAYNPGVVLPPIVAPYPAWYPYSYPYSGVSGYYNSGSGLSIGINLGGGYYGPSYYGPSYVPYPVYSGGYYGGGYGGYYGGGYHGYYRGGINPGGYNQGGYTNHVYNNGAFYNHGNMGNPVVTHGGQPFNNGGTFGGSHTFNGGGSSGGGRTFSSGRSFGGGHHR